MEFEWGFREKRVVGWSACGSEARRLSEPMIGKRASEARVEGASGAGFVHTGARRVSGVRDDARMLMMVAFHDESGGLG